MPVRVSVVSGSPTIAEVGLIEVRVGARLLTVKVWAPEVPPVGGGLKTVMSRVPAEARLEAGMMAVS